MNENQVMIVLMYLIIFTYINISEFPWNIWILSCRFKIIHANVSYDLHSCLDHICPTQEGYSHNIQQYWSDECSRLTLLSLHNYQIFEAKNPIMSLQLHNGSSIMRIAYNMKMHIKLTYGYRIFDHINDVFMKV